MIKTGRLKFGSMRRNAARGELLPPYDPNRDDFQFRTWRLRTAIAAAAIGTAAGIFAAVVSGNMGNLSAAYVVALDLRDAPLAGGAGGRSELIAAIAHGHDEQRLAAPARNLRAPPASTPRLIVIFDDIGLDRSAFDEIMGLPGPVTLSFLPYGRELQPMVDRARRRGDEILLHLPMEPAGNADPGPHSLSLGMPADELFGSLEWNLSRFSGFVGVNNHMGSKFTRNDQMMKRVLSYLDQKGLFFIDSLTTGASSAASAGAAVGADVFLRDVFLDAETGKENIRSQTRIAERIAEKTGYAIVICHPRRETLDVIGPWLTTAPARGFRLDTVSSLKRDEAIVTASAHE